MATIKVNKKNHSYMYTIKAKSANNTYIPYEDALEATTSIDFDLSASDEDLFVKSGDDLIIYSIFSSSNKVVTNTVKNYFKLAPTYQYCVVITQDGSWGDIVNYYDYINENSLSAALPNEPTIIYSEEGKEYSFVGTTNNDVYSVGNTHYNGSDYIYDVAGNDMYAINAKQPDRRNCTTVQDFSGNDEYVLSNKTYAKIYDMKGNDLYRFTGQADYDITDKGGNDNYIVYDAGVYISSDKESQITDEKGNDNYTFVKATYGIINDKGGNDKYNLTGGKYTAIKDSAGKDTYTLTTETSDVITDNSGNDKYTVSVSGDITIQDFAGKDVYNVSYSNDINIQDGLDGETKSGNDTYNLTYVSRNTKTKSLITDFAGNDKYNFSYTDSTDITDYKGSDTYTIKNSSITINDNGIAEKVGKKVNKKLANDKYTAINSYVDITDTAGDDIYKYINSYGEITDNGGNDKYTISGSNTLLSLITITDKTASNDIYNIGNILGVISDEGGKDSYSIKSSNTGINDSGKSNKDSYTIKGLDSMVTITDDGGTGDTLKITDVNKNNLIFMLDYTKDAKGDAAGNVNSGDLFIFDKTNSGCTVIKDYFKLESSYIEYTSQTEGAKTLTSDGCIEKIYAGKKDITNEMFSQLAYGKADELSNTVASWLSDTSHSYGSVSAFLTSSTADVADFIAYVANN